MALLYNLKKTKTVFMTKNLNIKWFSYKYKKRD